MTLRWDSDDDWDDAAGREGVVAADYGARDAGTVQLGWQPGYKDKHDTYDVYDYTPHMEVYWPFDETGTQTAYDVVGGWTKGYYAANGNNVTTGLPGPLGSNSWGYNGVDSKTMIYWDDDPSYGRHVDIGDDPTLSASFTVACWVYIDPTQPDSTGTIISKGKPRQRGAWALEVTGNQCRLGFGFWGDHKQYTGSRYWHRGTPSDYAGPHFIVATVGESEEKLRIYIDGEMQETTHGPPDDTWRPPLKAPYAIGAKPTGKDYFKGRISDVMLAGGFRDHEECMELTRAMTRGYFESAPRTPEYVNED